jgi:sulfopyruvate decarboxylase alpha subunit
MPAWVKSVAAGLMQGGIQHVVYVPDTPLSSILRRLEAEGRVPLTLATREEEGIGIAAGLHLGGQRPAVLMQSSGLGNAINALGSLLISYQIPVLLVISLRGELGEWNVAQVPMGRAVRPILDALGIQHVTPTGTQDLERTVAMAAALAFEVRLPVAYLLPPTITGAEA